MTGRIARDLRRIGVRVVLGSRDVALLRGLARLRLATTDDLVRLYFWNVRRDTAASRLRRLHDSGFIAAHSIGLQSPNLYSLGSEGKAWATDQGLIVRPALCAPFAHHLALVQAWSQVAAAFRAHSDFRLSRFEPDWELRSRMAGLAPAIVPDGAVELEAVMGGAVVRFGLEIDLSTERPGAFRRKIASYDLAPYFEGAPAASLVVLLFGAGPRRTATVKGLVGREWNGAALVCGASEWPGALLPILASPPRGSSPCGEGSLADLTHSRGAGSVGQGEEPSR